MKPKKKKKVPSRKKAKELLEEKAIRDLLDKAENGDEEETPKS